jgi:hypothetical protein
MQDDDKVVDPIHDATAPADSPEKSTNSLFSNLLAELESSKEPEPVVQTEISRPVACTAALESIGHLQKKVQSLWGSPDLNVFITRLFVDSRDGVRKGLPLDVADELVWLGAVNRMSRAIDTAGRLNLGLGEAYRLVEEGDQARLEAAERKDSGPSAPIFASRRDEVKPGFLRRLWQTLRDLARSPLAVGVAIVLLGAGLYWLRSGASLFP